MKTLAAVFAILVIFNAGACAREPAILFDWWSKNESVHPPYKVLSTYRSSNGEYTIELSRKSVDYSGLVLTGNARGSTKASVLGYGSRSACAQWYDSHDGPLAVIVESRDIGLNQVFVVMPHVRKGNVEWEVLYQTPSEDAGPFAGVAEKCWWTVKSVDPLLGSIRLHAEWHFTNSPVDKRHRAITEGDYNVPLYFGYRKSK